MSPSWRWDILCSALDMIVEGLTPDLEMLISEHLKTFRSAHDVVLDLGATSLVDHMSGRRFDDDIEAAILLHTGRTPSGDAARGMLSDHVDLHVIQDTLRWDHHLSVSITCLKVFTRFFFDLSFIDAGAVQAWIEARQMGIERTPDGLRGSMRQMYWQLRSGSIPDIDLDEAAKHIMISSMIEADALAPLGRRAARDVSMLRDTALRAYGLVKKHTNQDEGQSYDWNKNIGYTNHQTRGEDERERPVFERVDPTTEKTNVSPRDNEQNARRRAQGGGEE